VHDTSSGSKGLKAGDPSGSVGEQEGSPQYPGPSEFYVVVTRKIPKPLEPGRAREIVESLLYWDMVVNDPEAVLEAIDLSEKHRLSFWDALVVQAAVVAGAEVLFSEDLNPGQVIEGVRVENPF